METAISWRRRRGCGLTALLVCLLAALVQAAEGSKPAEATDAERGWALFRRSEWAAAAEAFTKAIEINPKDANSHMGRGGSRLKLGDEAGAKTDFAKAFVLDPQLAKEAVAPAKDPIAEFTKAIALNPKDRKAYMGRGWARGEQGNFRDAVQDFTKAIELDPTLADAHLARGAASLSLEDVPVAIADFDRVLQLDVKNAEAHYFRGNAKAMRADWSAALADLQQAVKLDAGFASDAQPLIDQCRQELDAAQKKNAGK